MQQLGLHKQLIPENQEVAHIFKPVVGQQKITCFLHFLASAAFTRSNTAATTHLNQLWGFYLRAVTIRERHLFTCNSGKNFCKYMYKGFNSELTCGDLVSKKNFQHLDQLLLFNKVVPINSTSNSFPHFPQPSKTKGSWRRTKLF